MRGYRNQVGFNGDHARKSRQHYMIWDRKTLAFASDKKLCDKADSDRGGRRRELILFSE